LPNYVGSTTFRISIENSRKSKKYRLCSIEN
jgi:hypothetical protein